MRTAIVNLNNNDLVRIGKHLAKGAIKGAIIYAAKCAVLVYLLVTLFNLAGLYPADDCDTSIWNRCGVKVVTDHKTGVQYLVAPNGGIILRNQKKP